MATRVKFKTSRGRKVSFLTHKKSRSAVKAKMRAMGKRLAKKYGFVSKKGKLFRKSPRRGLVRVRN